MSGNIPPLRGNQRLLLLGKTNSGKSFFARLMLQIAYVHGWRIVIVDPKRDWMGRGETAFPFRKWQESRYYQFTMPDTEQVRREQTGFYYSTGRME